MARKKTAKKKGGSVPKPEEQMPLLPTYGSNSRATDIQASHEQTYDLTKEEERLMTKYITPIREKKQAIKADLKKKHEITAPQFNARQNVYYFEREAAAGKDFITLQIIKEQWDATPVGGGVDLVDVMEKATKQRAEKEAEKNKATHTELEA